ncbi:MAG: glycosyltransferase family 39 protein [Hyphomicrobiaceae bacterium]
MVLVKSAATTFIQKFFRSIWEQSSYSILQLFILFSITLVAITTRLYGLAEKPLWYDEVLTLWRANLPLSELIHDSFQNKHFPLYFWVVKPFAANPWSEAFLRLPSVALGALCAFLTGAIALRLGGNCAGFVAGILMALSPCEVQYGQEARSYALTSAAILLSLWGLVRLAEQLAPATGARSPCQGAVGPWLAYAVGMNLALNTLGVAAPWFIAANIAVLTIYWIQRVRNGPIRTWVWVNFATAVAWLPGIVMIMAANQDAPLRGLLWTPTPSLELISQILAALYMLRVSDHTTLELMPPAVPLLGPALIGLALAGGWWLSRRPALASILFTATLTMPAAMAIVSIFHPIFLPRYLLWSTGPYFILVGLGVRMMPRLWRVTATIALALGAVISLMPYYSAETKPRWDQVAAYLQENAQRRDGLITSDGLSRIVLEAYMTRDGGGPPNFLHHESLGEIKRKFESGHTVWIIYGRAGQGPREPEGEFFARWEMFGIPTKRRAFGKHIVLARHDK